MQKEDGFSEFIDGFIDLAGTGWDYVGFADKTLGAGSAAFLSFVFVCRGVSSGGPCFIGVTVWLSSLRRTKVSRNY